LFVVLGKGRSVGGESLVREAILMHRA